MKTKEKAQPTPGPWFSFRNPNDGAWYIDADDRQWIIRRTSVAGSDSEMEANVLLMCNAHNILMAAKNLLAARSAIGEEALEPWHELEAAIAKAEGGK